MSSRQCDGCTLCCKLLAVEEIQKPKTEWCKHCDQGKGCRIYMTRPIQCQNFYCLYLTDSDLPEAWRPSKCKIVLSLELDGSRIAAHVDPGRPAAWKEEPFITHLQQMAALAVPYRGQVVVYIDKRAIVILPSGQVDLGVVADDEMIVTRASRDGVPRDAFKMKKSDPRAETLARSTFAEAAGVTKARR
jgi:hypothetical protein